MLVAGTLVLAALLRPAPASGPFARDFEAYYAAGAVRNAGGDPYGRDVWAVERTVPGVDASHDEMLPYVGPAAALPFWSLVARLPFARARAGWELLLAGAFVALILASLALAGSRLGPARVLAALALGGASGPVIAAFTLGQAALLGAAATALALLALERRSAWAVPAALVAAIQPNLALPLAVRLVDRRAAPALASAVAVFAALTLAAGGGIGGFAAYVQRLRLHGDAERFLTIQHTVAAVVASFGLSRAAATGAGTVIACGALALIIVAAVRLRAQPVLAACIAIALLPFAVPFFHEHDFAIVLVPVIVLLVRGDARLRALAAAAATMTLVDWFGMAQRPSMIPTIALLAFAVAGAAALLGHDDERAGNLTVLAPLVTAGMLVAACGALAHAFLAPVWPAALGAYHAPPGAGISTIWAAENQHAGLDATMPAWGLLRAIPLAGCALVAAGCALLAAPAYATTIAPSRTVIATGLSDSPIHGPSVQ